MDEKVVKVNTPKLNAAIKALGSSAVDNALKESGLLLITDMKKAWTSGKNPNDKKTKPLANTAYKAAKQEIGRGIRDYYGVTIGKGGAVTVAGRHMVDSLMVGKEKQKNAIKIFFSDAEANDKAKRNEDIDRNMMQIGDRLRKETTKRFYRALTPKGAR